MVCDFDLLLNEILHCPVFCYVLSSSIKLCMLTELVAYLFFFMAFLSVRSPNNSSIFQSLSASSYSFRLSFIIICDK